MQDIPKLFTAFAEWTSCVVILLEYYEPQKKKMTGLKYGILFGGLAALSGIQLFCGTVSNWLWLLGMAVAVGVMCLMLKTILDISYRSAVFETTGAFIKAEFVAAFQWQIYSFYRDGFKYNSIVTEIVFVVLLYLICFGLCYFLEKTFVMSGETCMELPIQIKEVVIIWLAMLIIFSLSNLSYIHIRSPFSGTDTLTIFNIRTIVDLAGLFMFEAIHVQLLDSEKRREIDSIRYILKMQYIQFRESQENINLINQKYHDLKHQLNIIRNEKDEEQREKYLDEIESGIRKYESQYKTGNSVLDTILSTKAQQCLKLNVKITVVADGKLLNDIHVMDICTIFGNALENALEYEAQLPDIEERMIHVSVSQKASFICILVENYYEKESEEDTSIFLTTSKADSRFHGFGIRSIQYSVQKYGGYVNIKVQQHWFRVEIMIPLSGKNIKDSE